MAEATNGMNSEIAAIVRTKLNGPAARMDALSRLTDQSQAMWWAHIFIIILFIIIESAPIMVKLISKGGPYDSLLHMTEHQFRCREVEGIAMESDAIKKRTGQLAQTEQGFVVRRLDAELT
jgi:hypothetical protein